MYEPKPIDTSNVKLPDEMEVLVERLAENAHDIWAKQRMKDGWAYGSRRDDGEKKHPCLIPYRDLPESEKEYDRLIAIETLKTIMVIGYDIKHN
jgi:hypothetical protein